MEESVNKVAKEHVNQNNTKVALRLWMFRWLGKTSSPLAVLA